MPIHSYINVLVRYQDFTLDLRIPIEIDVAQLGQELKAVIPALGDSVGNIQVRVPDKALLLQSHEKLSDHPLSHGDTLWILSR